MAARALTIAVTYDLRSDYLAAGYSPEETAEFDAEVTIAAICEALAGLGHRPVRIGSLPLLVECLARGERWDAAFNICEGIKGVAREAQVPALLEAYEIPFLFSDPLTLALALDKAMAKRVVRSFGVPTPDFAVIEAAGGIAAVALPFPLFLKPVAEGSGKGIDAHSRVGDEAALERTALDLLARYGQSVLVERFLPGREFTVGLVGTGAEARILGVSEIVPKANFIGHGYGLENKEGWEDKLEVRYPDDATAEEAGEVALKAWRALRCRDGGRADIRCDAEGRPHFIEVNPLAGLRPGYSDLCFIAAAKGLSYQDLIGEFLASFFRRHPALEARGRAAQAQDRRRLLARG